MTTNSIGWSDVIAHEAPAGANGTWRGVEFGPRTRDGGAGLGLLSVWARRVRTRRALAELDARLLADVGLTRAEAAREAGKPFWVA